MKKQILKVLTLIFVLALIFALPMSAEEYLTGDMNGDGVVNSDDAIYLLRHTLSKDNYPLACNHKNVDDKCALCGVELPKTTCPDDKHDFEFVGAQAPTCTNIGWNAYTKCKKCDYIEGYVEKPSLGHETILVEEKASSCTEVGWLQHIACTRCDYKVGYQEISALGHDEINHNAKTATCLDIGWDVYVTCSRCTYSTYKEISALGHDEINHNAKTPTCLDVGWDAYVTCSRCEYKVGYNEIPALGHDEINHNAKTPTCLDIGWDAYVTCSRCEYKVGYNEIPALGHDEINHNAKAATCLDIGWNAYVTCSRCTYSTYKEISALGHDKINHNAKAATCTDIGWKPHIACSRCDYKVDYQEIPALGHTYANGVNGKCANGCGYIKGSEGLVFISNGDGTCYVCGIGTCTDTELSIPNISPSGDYVIGIGESAFYDCSTLTSVMIPDSITSIGNYAFYECKALENIYFNATAMNDLSSSNYVFHNAGQSGGGIEVVIGKNVTKIPAYLFNPSSYKSYRPKIKCVEFEDGSICTTIGEAAFYHCIDLTSVTIGNDVTDIGIVAFNRCYRLVEVINKSSFLNITTGSESYGHIASFAFEVHDGDSKIVNKNGYLFYTYDSVNYLVGYVGSDTELVLPENYNGQNYEIHRNAFRDCINLTSITVPDCVTKIGYYAFDGCANLTSITFKDTSNWYRTTKSSYTGGIQTSVLDGSTNATNFTSNYYDYYWYKK